MELEINRVWILFNFITPPPPLDLHFVGGKIATDLPYLSSFSFFFFPFLSSFPFPSLPSLSFRFAGGGGKVLSPPSISFFPLFFSSPSSFFPFLSSFLLPQPHRYPDPQLVGGKIATDTPLLFFSSSPIFLPFISFFFLFSLHFLPSLLFLWWGRGRQQPGRQGPFAPPPPLDLLLPLFCSSPSSFFPFLSSFPSFPSFSLSLSLSLFFRRGESTFFFFLGGGGAYGNWKKYFVRYFIQWLGRGRNTFFSFFFFPFFLFPFFFHLLCLLLFSRGGGGPPARPSWIRHWMTQFV